MNNRNTPQIVRIAPKRSKPPSRLPSWVVFAVILLIAVLAGLLVPSAGEKDVPQPMVTESAQELGASGLAVLQATDSTLLTNLVEPDEVDLYTQRRIYELSGMDDNLFCCVMAIAKQETEFNADAVGDEGNSLGLMQINVIAQHDRIERLGVTDLFDPVQNAAVAIDYIRWITQNITVYGDPYASPDLYMAYNMGLAGYREHYDPNSTYCMEAIATYYQFLVEMRPVP